MSVDDCVVEGDKISDRITVQDTHEGEFLGIEPTGKEIETRSMVTHYVDEGECVADYGVLDTLGLLQQLGRS